MIANRYIRALLAACTVLAGYAVMASALAQAQAPAAPPVLSGPQPPPSGAEREALIQAIRTDYPAMPARLVPLLADSRRRISDGSRCELLEWLTSAESTGPVAARESAAFYLPTCMLPVDDLTPETARAMLADRPLAAELREGVLTIVAHSPEGRPRLCCSAQLDLQRLGESDYWAFRRRLPDAERAVLTLNKIGSDGIMTDSPVVVRGPSAPPAPPRVDGPLHGRMVFDRTLRSDALEENRKLAIYLPPGWSKDRRWPAVYLADGAAFGFAPIVERMILSGEIRPLVLVSALPAPFGIDGPAPSLPVDLRGAEYINRYPGGQGQDRFDRHMTFFASELTRYAQAELAVSDDPKDVAVAGYSNGGVLALWAGLLHPDIFGEVISMSPGMVFMEPGDLLGEPRSRFQLSAGLYEPSFLQAARRAEATLSAAGFDVTGRYPAAGHASDQWDLVFYEALKKIYPAR